MSTRNATKVLLAALLVACSSNVLAQSSPAYSTSDLLRAWSWQPPLISGILLAAALYGRGVAVLWRRAGQGAVVGPSRVIAFGLGLLTVFLALVSPIDALGGVLFTGHMIQHLLLMVVAAPLLVVGAPLLPMLWSLPRRARLGAGRWWLLSRRLRAFVDWLTAPSVGWLLYALTLWVWHVPTLYRLALRNGTVHELMHLSFLVAGLLFWWSLLQPLGRRRLNIGMGVLYLFTTTLHSMALALLITLAEEPLYYLRSLGPWGLSPLEDQQLAGLLMWIPPNLIYLGILVTLFLQWMQSIDESRNQAQA